ncbi:hypothetical protein AQUCO_06600052v1 [Aquilegia coerulea]|uniref:Uncharacterized protein n=1 Tax=Aquilegia coerulea TaxID=218851 RepID=A0A2G5CC80_AQUCA|nr:hypothetical protein AQUCO_06600052v1 [Aquilegia coerulea]
MNQRKTSHEKSQAPYNSSSSRNMEFFKPQETVFSLVFAIFMERSDWSSFISTLFVSRSVTHCASASWQ